MEYIAEEKGKIDQLWRNSGELFPFQMYKY